MPRRNIVAAVLTLTLAAALSAQRATFPNIANLDHSAWAEVATPPGAFAGDAIKLVTDQGRTFRGVLLERGGPADFWALLLELPEGQTVTGILEDDDTGRDPFTLHPAISLLQVLPMVVDVERPDGSKVTIPRVPIRGADLQVVEQNPARLVLQARYSTGALHADVWVYITTLHPAVRFQAEIHYVALDERAAETYPARAVRFRWPNAPEPIELWSDAAALEGWKLRGAEFVWEPPYRPQPWAARPADNPPREHVLGWATKVLFDGMILFGDDDLSRPLREGARFGPVTGVYHEWDGAFGALGAVPRGPTSDAVDLDWRVPGNAYSRRWLTLNFATNDAGFQAGFGDVGAAPVVSALRPELFRPLRLAAVDTALRPGHLRDTRGELVLAAESFPTTVTLAGQPTKGYHGLDAQTYPSIRYGQSGRRWGDDEHRRERELTAFLHLALDYQLRAVADSAMQTDLTQARRPPGWWGTSRNGGRRLLTMVELGRVLPHRAADLLAYLDDLERALAKWEGGTALAANPAARELVIETSRDARGECDAPHWSPWETSRAAAACWAAYRWTAEQGHVERAARWRAYATRLARTVALTLRTVDGQPRVPYRVSYAGGLEDLPAGWTEPGASTVNFGSSDWLPWSRTALEIVAAVEWSTEADLELQAATRQALEFRDREHPPRGWNDCAWVGGVRPPARK